MQRLQYNQFIYASLLPHASIRGSGIIQTVMDSPYRFGGKERLDESGLALYDFGARHYTTTLPRWLTMDSLAEKYYGVSPYVYCAGNPVVLVDPNGMDWYRNDNDEYIWRDTNEGEITENDVMYKNVGTSATFALDDGSYGIHYQNMRVARANVPISFESLVEQNPGIVGRLLGTHSSLSEEVKEALMQDFVRTGQAVFLNAPETRFVVDALMTVLFLPEEVVSFLDMPKKAFHLLRLEEKEGLTIESLIQKASSVEKPTKGRRQGFVKGRSIDADYKSLIDTYGSPEPNKKGIPIIHTKNGPIVRHISTKGGQPTLDLPMDNGEIIKLRYE